MAHLIFVADANEEKRSALMRILQKEGYETLDSENGRQALKTISINVLPKAIILNNELPEIDTLDVCKELKRDTRTRKVPIVILKGADTKEEPFRELGIDEFLAKPVTQKDLLTSVAILVKYGSRKRIPKPDQYKPLKTIATWLLFGLIGLFVFMAFIRPMLAD